MQFVVKRDILLKSLNFVQGVVEKKNTLPILSNVLLELKEKKLSNIYSGRKLSLIVKKLEDGSNTIVNFIYPINNTSSVEIRKSQNKYLVKENILRFLRNDNLLNVVDKNKGY